MHPHFPAQNRGHCQSAQLPALWSAGFRELGAEPDILKVLVLKGRSPLQVNMIVLNKDLGIPKPFGPQIGEECCLETQVRALLEPLGLSCTFIDDISAYHKFLGEVHCGTNVLRKPFAFKWWHMVP